MSACKDCKYYHKNEHQNTTVKFEQGDCRRFPPQWMRANGHDDARFVPVNGDQDACGEYKKGGA